ncbi:MAG: HEPN domain-containing protein [Candidatus Pacearchaeota archaeon]
MSFENCKKKGLIKKDLNAKERCVKEIDSAKHFFESARRIFKIDEFDMAIISSYNSCFHFLRYLLFKEGYIEKSHYCLIEAVKSLYNRDKELLEMLEEFDKVRRSRHQIQYRGVFADKEEAEYVLDLNKRIKETVLSG